MNPENKLHIVRLSIREMWDDIVRRDFDGDYARADAAFPSDEEAKQDAIERRHELIRYIRQIADKMSMDEAIKRAKQTGE